MLLALTPRLQHKYLLSAWPLTRHWPVVPAYIVYAGLFSPNSGGTLDERGGCTTGCALNVIAEEEAYLVETAAEIRAEEAIRAVIEAQVLNRSLAALSAAEEVRGLREEGELHIALDAERKFEDERADAEAKKARQRAAREKSRLEEVQLALTQASNYRTILLLAMSAAMLCHQDCLRAIIHFAISIPSSQILMHNTCSAQGHTNSRTSCYPFSEQELGALRSELSELKDAISKEATRLDAIAAEIRAEEAARAVTEAQALHKSLTTLVTAEDKRAQEAQQERDELKYAVTQLQVRRQLVVGLGSVLSFSCLIFERRRSLICKLYLAVVAEQADILNQLSSVATIKPSRGSTPRPTAQTTAAARCPEVCNCISI